MQQTGNPDTYDLVHAEFLFCGHMSTYFEYVALRIALLCRLGFVPQVGVHEFVQLTVEHRLHLHKEER